MKLPRWIEDTSLFNSLQIVIWTLFALALLPQQGHFAYDEAFFYDLARATGRGEIFPVYGPFISLSYPPAFTPGGGLSLLLAPPFVFGTDPRWGTAWIILLSSLGIWFFDRTLERIDAARRFRIASVVFLTWSAWHAHMTDRIWNAHLYWFMALLLLSLALRIIHRVGKQRWLWFIYGFASAWICQIHLGGGLAVAMTGLLILRFAGKREWVQELGLAAAGFVVPYLPYAAYEVTHQFHNTLLMRHAIRDPYRWRPIEAALQAPTFYLSQFVGPLKIKDWLGALKLVTHLVGLALIVFGLRQKHWARFLFIASYVSVPIYFLMHRRDFHDHYIGALIPLVMLMGALSLWKTWDRWDGTPRKHWAPAYLTFFAVVGVIATVQRYTHLEEAHRVSDRISAVQEMLASGQPVPSHFEDEEAYVLWVVAKRLLDQELRFKVDDRVCEVKTGYPGDHPQNTVKIHTTAYFLCEPSGS